MQLVILLLFQLLSTASRLKPDIAWEGLGDSERNENKIKNYDINFSTT